MVDITLEQLLSSKKVVATQRLLSMASSDKSVVLSYNFETNEYILIIKESGIQVSKCCGESAQSCEHKFIFSDANKRSALERYNKECRRITNDSHNSRFQ